MSFPTTGRRYADKWLRKRVFFCSSRQGNPMGVGDGGARSLLLFQKRARSMVGVKSIVPRWDSCGRLVAHSTAARPVEVRARRNFAHCGLWRKVPAQRKSPAEPGF
jgi:hypothetical protein